MLELGNILDTGYDANVAYLTPHGVSDSAKPAASGNIADDAAVAVTRRSLRAEIAGAARDGYNTEGELSLGRKTPDTMAAVREKMDKFIQFAEELAGGCYSAGKMSGDAEPDAEEIRDRTEESTSSVYSDVGELLAKLREEIAAIDSFDGFLLGVYDKIDEFSEQAEFGLEQVLDVEQHMAQLRTTMELSKFSLTRVRAEALKALRCQGDLEPERVLHLLKDRCSRSQTPHAAKGLDARLRDIDDSLQNLAGFC